MKDNTLMIYKRYNCNRWVIRRPAEWAGMWQNVNGEYHFFSGNMLGEYSTYGDAEKALEEMKK